ncbi:MAG: hypothetical protein M1835_003801 [Candelina submexicana]|nr:MAG: hypothetical protein M1835_003801 [Candelina submexicana]
MSGSPDERSPPRKRQRRPDLTNRPSIPEEAVWDDEEEHSRALLDEPSYDRPAQEESPAVPSLDRPPRRFRPATGVQNNDERQAHELQEQLRAEDSMNVDVDTPRRRDYTPRFQSTTQGLRLISPDSDEEVLDEETIRRTHKQMKSAKRTQVRNVATHGQPPGHKLRTFSAADIDSKKLLWWELEQLVPDTVPLQRVREWQAVLDRIPSNSPAPTSDNTCASQHAQTAGASLRIRPTLPDYIPPEYPNIGIQAYKLSATKVQYADIAQRTPAGSRIAINSPEMRKMAGTHQSRINRYHGAYDIKHRGERRPKAGGKGTHSKFPKADWDDLGVGPNENGRAQVTATPAEQQEQRQTALNNEAERFAKVQPGSSSSSSHTGTAARGSTSHITVPSVGDNQESLAQGPVDRNVVHQQVEATRQDYQSLTGERAPRTNWQLSFSEQYAQLQAALVTWWRTNRRHTAKECPQLTDRGRRINPGDK